MRSLLSGWNTILTKLRFIRKVTRKGGKRGPLGRCLGGESLEDRRMLATMADIVFLLDLSGSNANGPAFNWLRSNVFEERKGDRFIFNMDLSPFLSQVVLGQIVPNGLFEGFTVVESTDVMALAQSAGINTSNQNYVSNSGPTLLLSGLLGFTVPPNEFSKISVGLINEYKNPQDAFPIIAVLWTLTNQAGLIFF